MNTLVDSLAMVPNGDSFESISNTPYCIFTTHRFENLKSRARWNHIISSLKIVATRIRTVFILHPVTRRKIQETVGLEYLRNAGVDFRDRMDYFTFIRLLKQSEFLITDGGSNQEECYYLGKPCFLMRNTTERSEGLEKNAIIGEFNADRFDCFLRNYPVYIKEPVTADISPSEVIVNRILEFAQGRRV